MTKQKKCIVCKDALTTNRHEGFAVCEGCLKDAPLCGSIDEPTFPRRGKCKNKAGFYPGQGWTPCYRCNDERNTEIATQMLAKHRKR